MINIFLTFMAAGKLLPTLMSPETSKYHSKVVKLDDAKSFVRILDVLILLEFNSSLRKSSTCQSRYFIQKVVFGFISDSYSNKSFTGNDQNNSVEMTQRKYRVSWHVWTQVIFIQPPKKSIIGV